MANVAGFNIPTPQEVQQQVRQQRMQQFASQQPLLIQNAILGNALDSLFGNPEVRRAQKTQDNIARAIAEAPEGADELESEMLRLKSVRDSVEDLSPDVADQVRQRLVQLEAQRVERNKLLAEESRAEATFQTDQAARGVKLAQDVNDSSTWFKGSAKREVLKTDTETQQQLAAAGWTKDDASTEAEAGAIYGTTKKVAQDLETALIGVDSNIAAMGSAASNYDPSFSTLPTQALLFASGKLDRLAPGVLNESQVRTLGKYTAWKRDTTAQLNALIKQITGAAMSNAEAARIMSTAPTADDSPVQYISKSRAVLKDLLGARKRASWVLGNGFGDKIEGRDSWDKFSLDQFGNVSEEEVDAVMMNMYGTTGRDGQPARSRVGTKQTKSGVKFTVEGE